MKRSAFGLERNVMEHYTVKELPENERPYEKCEKYGPMVLSDSELLAIIIKAGTPKERATELATRILMMKGSRYGINVLNHVTKNELHELYGIGRVKTIQLMALCEIARRMATDEKREAITFSTPESIAAFYMEKMRHLEREQTRVLFLDSKLKMISDIILFEGTVGTAPMEPREILREALKADAVFFVVLHNHPSGDPSPSQADLNTTERIRQAAEYVGLRLRDHVIIGDRRFVSMKELGVL